MPAGEIVSSKTAECGVATGTGHHLHQIDRGLQKARQTISGMVNVQLAAQIGVLGGDAGGTVVRMADPGPKQPIAWDPRAVGPKGPIPSAPRAMALMKSAGVLGRP